MINDSLVDNWSMYGRGFTLDHGQLNVQRITAIPLNLPLKPGIHNDKMANTESENPK